MLQATLSPVGKSQRSRYSGHHTEGKREETEIDRRWSWPWIGHGVTPCAGRWIHYVTSMTPIMPRSSWSRMWQ